MAPGTVRKWFVQSLYDCLRTNTGWASLNAMMMAMPAMMAIAQRGITTPFRLPQFQTASNHAEIHELILDHPLLCVRIRASV